MSSQNEAREKFEMTSFEKALLDWKFGRLTSGATISATDGVTSSPAGLKFENQSLSGQTFTALVSSGDTGTEYETIVKVTGSDGQKLELHGFVLVED